MYQYHAGHSVPHPNSPCPFSVDLCLLSPSRPVVLCVCPVVDIGVLLIYLFVLVHTVSNEPLTCATLQNIHATLKGPSKHITIAKSLSIEMFRPVRHWGGGWKSEKKTNFVANNLNLEFSSCEIEHLTLAYPCTSRSEIEHVTLAYLCTSRSQNSTAWVNTCTGNVTLPA